MTRDEVLAIIKQAEEEDWEEFRLNGYPFGELPNEIGNLTKLKSLNLVNNKLKYVPNWIGKLTNLQSLYLNNNKIENLPSWLHNLKDLNALSVSDNRISKLSEYLELPELRILHLSFNQLDTLPKELLASKKLEVLHLNSNQNIKLPDWFGSLVSLKQLYLNNIGLNYLPEWMQQLINLEVLHLDNNFLVTLPDWISSLTNLKVLSASNNMLETLPTINLNNLQSLNISKNQLAILPQWLMPLSNLEFLNISKNPISEPSPETLGDALPKSGFANLDSIRRYFAQLQDNGKEIFFEAKLLIIGEGGSGKTSFVKKLVNPNIPMNYNEISTEGIVVNHWDVDLEYKKKKETFRVNIWDFGGQEIYNSTHQFFFTKRSVYVLVANTRHQISDFYKWLRIQETFGGNSPIILLKNRNRKAGGQFRIKNLSDLQERFSNLKEDIEVDISKIPQDPAWPMLLKILEEHILSLDNIGQTRPRSWVRVREALRNHSENTISIEEFSNICFDNGLRSEEDISQLSDYLHNLGDILHFQDDQMLEEIVILKPTWGLDAVYRLFDNQEIISKRGKFSYRDLRKLWHEDIYRTNHTQLLRLMQNFDLCYPIYNRPDTYIAPQLLSDNRPQYNWDPVNNLQVKYKYRLFMPHGIISRAIVKLHDLIENQEFVWKSGAILHDGNARAEIISDQETREIHIRIVGTNKRDLLMEILKTLDEMHRKFPKLDYQRLIPCNCGSCHSNMTQYFFDLDLLNQARNKRIQQIQCYSSFEMVSINSLIGDDYEIPGSPNAITNTYNAPVTIISNNTNTAVSLGDEGSATVN